MNQIKKYIKYFYVTLCKKTLSKASKFDDNYDDADHYENRTRLDQLINC
jgi:hypothetical protein